MKKLTIWEDLSIHENLFFFKYHFYSVGVCVWNEIGISSLCKQAEPHPSSHLGLGSSWNGLLAFCRPGSFTFPSFFNLTPLAVAAPRDRKRQLGYLIHPHVTASCSLQLICYYCPQIKSNQAQCGQRDSINYQKLPSREGCLEVPCQKE